MFGAITAGGAGVGVGLGLISVTGSVAGVSAAGISSGLATLGGVIGGGMLYGVFVASAPAAILGYSGYKLVDRRNKKKLEKVKEEFLEEALKRHHAIMQEFKKQPRPSLERIEYLNHLNALLKQIIKNLQSDLSKGGWFRR